MAGFCRPAQAVGGDYYDLFSLGHGPALAAGRDGRLALAIGDISGKGISASLLMASLRASLRSLSPGAAAGRDAGSGGIDPTCQQPGVRGFSCEPVCDVLLCGVRHGLALPDVRERRPQSAGDPARWRDDLSRGYGDGGWLAAGCGVWSGADRARARRCAAGVYRWNLGGDDGGRGGSGARTGWSRRHTRCWRILVARTPRRR